jgi:hypothetical protein
MLADRVEALERGRVEHPELAGPVLEAHRAFGLDRVERRAIELAGDGLEVADGAHPATLVGGMPAQRPRETVAIAHGVGVTLRRAKRRRRREEMDVVIVAAAAERYQLCTSGITVSAKSRMLASASSTDMPP